MTHLKGDGVKEMSSKDCALLLAPRVTKINSDKFTKLSFLNIVDERNYEQFKQNAAETVPDYFSGSYDEFREKRDSTFKLEKFDMTVAESMAYLRIDLSPEQINGFNSCVRLNSIGLSYYEDHVSEDQ